MDGWFRHGCGRGAMSGGHNWGVWRALSQEGEGRPFSTCVPVYPGAALGCEGGNTQGEKIQGDQIIFPFVSE